MKKNVLFLEHFSEFLSQGYTLEQSLTLSHQIFHLSFYDNYINALSQGEDIYDILLKGEFPNTFINYLSFYRNKGCLSEAIKKSLNIYTKQENFINQIIKQLTYPLFLMIFLFCFSIFVLLFLLPQISLMFEAFDIRINLFTLLIFYCFQLFPVLFIIIFLSSFLLFVCLIYGVKKKNYKVIDFFLHRFVTSYLLKKYFSLKFALFYNELLLNHIDTATIIEVLNDQMCDEDMKIILYEIKRLLIQGEDIEDALRKIKYFDPLLISFFQINFYNVNYKDSLSFYIENTYKQVENYINNFLRIIIPIVYCFVSFFVISIYVAIIIPLISGFSNI